MVREEHSYFTLFLSGNYFMFQMTQMQTSYVHVYKKTFNLGKHGYRAYKYETAPLLVELPKNSPWLEQNWNEDLGWLFSCVPLYFHSNTGLDSSRAPNCWENFSQQARSGNKIGVSDCTNGNFETCSVKSMNATISSSFVSNMAHSHRKKGQAKSRAPK